MISEVILLAKTIFIFTMLAYFSYLDIKYREIKDTYIYMYITFSVIFSIITFYTLASSNISLVTLIAYLAISIVCGPVLAYVMYKFKLMGLGDVYAIIGFSLTYFYVEIYDHVLFRTSTKLHLPPVIPLLLYANILMAITIPYNVIVNIVRYRQLIPQTTIYKKILILINGRPMKIRDYLKTRHVYLLEDIVISPEGGIVRKYKSSFDINAEYIDEQRRIKELVEKGFLTLDDYIWTSYGIPYIVLLFIGFIILLIIGDLPMIYILMMLIR